MKVKILLVFFALTNASCFAQETNIWGNISRSVNVKSYSGKNFTVQVAAKVTTTNANAQAGMYVSVNRENGKTGLYKNMSGNPIKSKEWKVYSLSGKLDKTAAYLTVGLGYSEQGIFYFDDFKLFIENDAGAMDEIPLFNSGFEEDSLQSKHAWWYNKDHNFYNISLTSTEFYTGKQSCKIDGTVFQQPKQYGDNDSTGKFATVNGIKIYYEEYGKGEPLLLLHGNSMSIHSFRLQIPELSKYFHLYAADTRGHGRSGDDGKTYTYDLFAADMNALLDELHLDSVNVLGWSDGGNTGLIMAMRYPAKVKRLITMGAVIFIGNAVVDKSVFKFLHKEKKELEADPSSDAAGRLRRIELLLTEPKHSFGELRSVNCPVLVIAGEKDVVKETHTKGIAAAIPNAALLIVPKATHELPWEDASFFNKAVLDFLQRRY